MTLQRSRLDSAKRGGSPHFRNFKAALTLCLAFAPLTRAAQPTGPSTELIARNSRKPAPSFAIADVYGKNISLSTYKGRVVLLDFWAVNCGGCKLEIPWFVEFKNKYQDRGLSLIGLDMYGEAPNIIKPFLRSSKVDYPIAVGSDALGEQYGLREMPLTVLIDREGRIAEAHAGVVDKARFEKNIQQLLSE